MNRQTVLEAIARVAPDVEPELADLDPTVDLWNELQLDSMDRLSVVKQGPPPCRPTVKARSPTSYQAGSAAIRSSVCWSASNLRPKRLKRPGSALSSKMPWMKRAFMSRPCACGLLSAISA